MKTDNFDYAIGILKSQSDILISRAGEFNKHYKWSVIHSDYQRARAAECQLAIVVLEWVAKDKKHMEYLGWAEKHREGMD